MVIPITMASYSRSRKLKDKYIKILKKYKVQETLLRDDGSLKYEYHITLNSLDDIFNLINELGHPLIIDDEGIMIYDDYVE